MLRSQINSELDVASCLKYISHYEMYFRQNNYDAAFEPWKKAFETCAADDRASIYLDGADLLRKKLDKVDKDEKEELLLLLLRSHMKLAKYFPKAREEAIYQLRSDVQHYLSDDTARLSEYMSKIDIYEQQLKGNEYKMAIGKPEYSGNELKSIEKSVIYSGISAVIAESSDCYLHVRYELDDILKEQQFGHSGLVSDTNRVPLGEFYAVDAVCTISVIYENSLIYISASVLEVATGRVLGSYSDGVAYIMSDDIVELEKLSLKIGRELMKQIAEKRGA